jgi:hypothetical protein
VNSACFSINANESFTAAWWARSIPAATAGSATAHKVDTDFNGENVRSYPATVWVRGRDSFAICPASSRASIGSRPCSAAKNSRATSVRTRAIRSRHRRAGRQAGRRLDHPDAFRHLQPKRADDTIDNSERHAQLGHLLEVADSEVRSFQLLLPELGQRVQTATEQRSHLLRCHRRPPTVESGFIRSRAGLRPAGRRVSSLRCGPRLLAPSFHRLKPWEHA